MYWSYVLAAIGVTGTFFVGRKVIWAWLVLLVNECLWTVYAITTEQYGFILAAIAYGAVYIRSYIHWSKEPVNEIHLQGDTMSKKKIKLPLKWWKNPIAYVKFHRSMKKLKKAL
jgi:nicotinamide riboside transporter PnuC